MMQTLVHIPLWVWAILIALAIMGLRQTRARELPSRRVLVINLVLTALTLLGVLQLWWHTPWLWAGLLSWVTTMPLVTWVLGQGPAPAGADYTPRTHRFTVPGSWVPLALYLSIFSCKFAVGMVQATRPEALYSLSAALGIGALYGLLSGLLNARSWRLWKLKAQS